jgi:hypothetical protein
MRVFLVPGVVVGVLCAGVIAAAVALNGQPGPSTAAQPAVAVMTSFPGLTSATGAPTLPSLEQLHPGPGAVLQATGPFDDRFKLGGLAFDGTTATGSVTITSDVSDLLELEVVAGFYGSDGTLLGTGRHVHHATEDGHTHSGPPSESEAFEIAVPAELAQRVASVAVGVPVLVNE